MNKGDYLRLGSNGTIYKPTHWDHKRRINWPMVLTVIAAIVGVIVIIVGWERF